MVPSSALDQKKKQLNSQEWDGGVEEAIAVVPLALPLPPPPSILRGKVQTVLSQGIVIHHTPLQVQRHSAWDCAQKIIANQPSDTFLMLLCCKHTQKALKVLFL